MSERAEDDVRGEQRRAARQQLKQQQQIQRGEGSTAMATVAERRSLPSPEIMLGQPWSNWVDAAKLHGNDGEFPSVPNVSEETRLSSSSSSSSSSTDMPIFGQCPAQDDFYLVMCSHCSQVVKPQAFQAHYERRHSSVGKPASTSPFPVSARNRSSGLGPGLGSGSVAGVASGGILSRPSTTASSLSSSSTSPASSNPKLLKPAKEKLPGTQRRPPYAPFRMIQPEKILTSAVKVEKMHLRVEPSAKLVQAPSAPATTSSSSTSSSSTTVSSNTTTITTSSSSSALKPGLNCPSIPKPPLLAPGQIPNGKGHLSVLSDKKQDSSSSASSRRHLNKKVNEREFNPDIHCGVVDTTARKPCTRSLTCKTHSLSQRRAVPGRRKRFDTLLAEHKNRARERERERELHQPHSQQNPSLRDPHPSSHLAAAHDTHQVAHGNGPTPDATKPLPVGKPKFHSPGLPRLNSSHGGATPGDPAVVHESPHHPQTTPDGFSRPSSDEGENEEREDNADKLDCHYSGYHPRPAAFCTFGSRLFGRGCYSFDRRWDRVRCALTTMMDKHVNSQMWKKIPLALENSSSVAPTHRTSTNSHGSTPSSGFLGPPATLPQTPYSQSYEGKSVLSYGTTLNARSSPQGGAEHPAYGITQARQVSSSPQMPSAHSSSSSSSSAPSLASGRALKSRSSSSSTTKSSSSFRPKEISSGSSTPVIPNSTGGGSGANSNSSSTSLGSGKKRKNSSILSSSHGPSESSSSNANYSSSSYKKNCANVGSSGSTYHHSSLGPSSSSSLSSSHSGVHSVGLNCGPTVRTNSLSLKAEPSGGSAGGSSGPPARGPPSGSPAESIKRMSVVMNSSDSTLSLGPFVHHQSSSDHHTSFSHHSSDGRLEGKKRKSSPASSGINSGGGAGGLGGGGGGGAGPGRPKVAKSPAINNIHGKHGRSIPGTPGLPNNSHLHQILLDYWNFQLNYTPSA
ncbi:Ataxin-7 Spinocerebellar ataxia type 7 protein -like protein [Collichthys lucidus]|uniref:Ataxin-7 Spinocerebellar ataxia type 7 protein-like protein n=1 Tax=Collichthys lucidus TaxID=240159 RepID=A0A4U5UAI7_COLLU|nr:Ataxin-7 Spinocerebellar ataxia type 7 protein -like protein [Collichthys lucidus]